MEGRRFDNSQSLYSASLNDGQQRPGRRPRRLRFWWVFFLAWSIPIGVLLHLNRQPLPDDIELPSGAILKYERCWFSVAEGRTAECARLETRDGTHTIPVVVLRAENEAHRRADPVLFITGGPGQAAGVDQASIDFWWEWLQTVRWNRDFVLFDPRGTGASEPSPFCEEEQALAESYWTDPPSTPDEEVRRYHDSLNQCQASLQTEGIDLRSYSTRHFAEDVVDLITALPSDEWNLYGVSNGTRVALEVLRTDSSSVRSVILDSVLPPQADQLMEGPSAAHRAFEKVFSYCERDARCRLSYPSLRQSFQTSLEIVRRSPATLSVYMPSTGQHQPVVIDDQNLFSLYFSSFYAWESIARLPQNISHAAQRNYDALHDEIQATVQGDLDPSFNWVVFYSAACHDAAESKSREAFASQVARYPRIGRFFEWNWDLDPCQVWDSGRAPEDFYQPVVSDVPGLIIAGDLDPITPPEWAQQIQHGLTSSHLFTFPGIGHDVIGNDTCASRLAGSFLDALTVPTGATCFDSLDGAYFQIDGLP